MPAFLKSSPRWLQGGWLLPLALLMLPNCILPPYEYVEGGEEVPSEVFDGGEGRTGAIMCDIPKVPFAGAAEASECATDEDIKGGYSLSYAAIALAQGENLRTIGLDYSFGSLAACGGKPKKIQYEGTFPDGTAVCLNCAKIGPELPAKYIDANAACVAKCVDLVNRGEHEPSGGAQSFCEANAKVSTNFNKNECWEGKCSTSGVPEMPFNDPRRPQEPVKWLDIEGDADSLDNDVFMKADATTTGFHDSSAMSEQTITRGDAWIEFTVKAADNMSHVVGVSTDIGTDADLDLEEHVAFALSLNRDNKIYIVHNGIPVKMPNSPEEWVGTYAAGDRFRVRITDNEDEEHTATISYKRVDANCGDAMVCDESPLGESQGTVKYPLRISALFREPGATLSNVKMVYIKDLP
jgi:hypothetical protein